VKIIIFDFDSHQQKTPTINAAAVWDDGEEHDVVLCKKYCGGTGVMGANAHESTDNAKYVGGGRVLVSRSAKPTLAVRHTPPNSEM